MKEISKKTVFTVRGKKLPLMDQSMKEISKKTGLMLREKLIKINCE